MSRRQEIPVVIYQNGFDAGSESGELSISRGTSFSRRGLVQLIGSFTAPNSEVGSHVKNICALPTIHSYPSKDPTNYPFWAYCRLIEDHDGSYLLHATIYGSLRAQYWLASNKRIRTTCHEILNAYFPSKTRARPIIEPQLFYDVVHTPNPHTVVPQTIQHRLLQAELYPFQKRAVAWLLSREKVKIHDDGSLTPVLHNRIPFSFEKYTDCRGDEFYGSRLIQQIFRKIDDSKYLHQRLCGGILCEEMGLGKTVELIDLICLHRRTEDLNCERLDEYTHTTTTISATTLIISPPSILDQWISELHSHAPRLKVLQYKGIKHSEENVEETLRKQDVVVTTYNVLASEIHHADEKPNRDFRYKKKYQPRASPLMKILWWRVCLDEAQMIESSVSNAAIVARRIPRCNSWAVTGTPLKKDLKDLLGLLIFLRFEPFCDRAVWKELCRSAHGPSIFSEIFGEIAMRHTKAQVRQELQLPSQKRIVVTVPFTAIEEQHYKDMFEEMCVDVGLDQSGAPTRPDWDPDSEQVVTKMKRWLSRLRQTCLHPEIGERNRRALGRKEGPLRTVDEVLQVMMEQNETSIRQEERFCITAKLIQGHLFSCTKGTDKGQALYRYLQAFRTATAAVIECRDQLHEDAVRRRNIRHSPGSEMHSPITHNDEQNDREGMLRNRLRNTLEMQHSSAFFVATAYYQVKMQKCEGNEESDVYKEYEKQESDYYEIAKRARQEMLREVSGKAMNTLKKLEDVKRSGMKPLPSFNQLPHYGGIEARKIFQAVVDIRYLMNHQAEQLQEWRLKLVELLSAALLDQNDMELTGEEYEETLENQDEQYVYLFVLRAAIADRNETLTGQVNALVYHEAKEALDIANKGQGHAPELMKACFETRKPLIPIRDNSKPTPGNEQSLRGTVSGLRSIITSVRFTEDGRSGNRATAEATILESLLSDLQAVWKEQGKALAALEKEYDLYRDVMNDRLEYYRQLQAISDTVKPYQEDESESFDENMLKDQERQELEKNEKVRSLLTKRKFLQHLRSQKAGEQERRPCIICLQTFENGVLTVCAHEFCKDCISAWLAQHHRCPVCKTHLRSRDYHNITYKPRTLRAEEEQAAPSPSSSAESLSPTSRSSIYSSISEEALNEIKSIDIPSSWGSKIDSIARHLLYLRTTDPGSKAVVFSQYREFLLVLGRALTRCKISYSRMAEPGGIEKFKKDASVECFLLHAKADSSGLNLVNATHVLLCEPLINTALELQAIARVHRIGQRHPTTVWMYLVSDTVEEAVYDISAARRLRLMGQRTNGTGSAGHSGVVTPAADEIKLDLINSMELQAASLNTMVSKGQMEGEEVAKGDLWACLFSKPRGNGDEELNEQISQEVIRHLRAEAVDQRASTSGALSN